MTGPHRPSLYLNLSVNDHGEVEWATVHLFDCEGVIANTHHDHPATFSTPYEELAELLEWGAASIDAHLQAEGVDSPFRPGS